MEEMRGEDIKIHMVHCSPKDSVNVAHGEFSNLEFQRKLVRFTSAGCEALLRLFINRNGVGKPAVEFEEDFSRPRLIREKHDETLRRW